MPVNAPPRRNVPQKPAQEPQVTKDRREALTGFGQLAQAPLIGFRLFADAGAVAMHVPNIAREIALLAETQEQVAALVDPLIKVGPYFGLVTAVLPLLLQVGVNHGRVPAGAMGTVPAVTLSAQVEAGLATQELEALTIQMQAEAAAAEVREKIAEQRRKVSSQVASRTVTVE